MRALIVLLFLSSFLSAAPEENREAWRWMAPLEIKQVGIVRLELAPTVLNDSREDLGDLRLLSPSGKETP